MNRTNNGKGILASLASILLAITVSVVLIVFYGTSKYVPLLLTSFILLMPTAVNAVLLIFSAQRNGEKQRKPRNAKGEASDAEVPDAENTKEISKLKKLGIGCAKLMRAIASFFVKLFFKIKNGAIVILTVVSVISVHILFWTMTGKQTSIYKFNYFVPVLLVVCFVLFIVFEKWCQYAKSDSVYISALLKNISSALSVSRLAIVCTAVAMALKLIVNVDIQKWAVYILWAIFIYETVFILLSLTVGSIRHEFEHEPDVSIPKPFAIGKQKDTGILSYLEKNTGITMRSLWSIKLVRNMIPYAVILCGLLIWVCTGIVQIESSQRGAVYRFGRLCEEELEPGLHFTLPWPMDKVEIYDTESVNKIIVGYSSTDENVDNIWTGNHGSNEYKLLLGGGNELVSINLRIEYKIRDLITYLKSNTSPEKVLEAKAYEAITYRIIEEDLNHLLSIDRSEFSVSFLEELNERILPYDTGLSIVSVVLESIHPPIEIGDVYQQVVGAELKAEKYILDAQAQAAVKIADAEKSYDTAVNSANSYSSTIIAQAHADVAEFMASVEADFSYPDSYRYHKYLAALTKAYGNSRLVIVGDGIDSSKIYIGKLTVGN